MLSMVSQIISISEFIKVVPEEYRRRWNIETGYRVKNTFKIRTCSKSPVVRTLYFILRCILFNLLNLLKSGLNITAYELKSATNSDIIQCIKYGYESLQAIPVKIFIKILLKYNKISIEVLRSRLSKT